MRGNRVTTLHAYTAVMQAAGLNNNKKIYKGYKVVYVLMITIRRCKCSYKVHGAISELSERRKNV